jgi:hypothetical protein
LKEIESSEDETSACGSYEIKKGIIQKTATGLAVIIRSAVDTGEAEEESGEREEEGEESDDKKAREEE